MENVSYPQPCGFPVDGSQEELHMSMHIAIRNTLGFFRTVPGLAAFLAGATIALFLCKPQTRVGAEPDPSACPSGAASCYQRGYAGLTPLEQGGRDTWYFWTGGGTQNGHIATDGALWRKLAVISHGQFDLLQAVDSRYRNQRFAKFGVINDPDCREAAVPDAYGLYLDLCDSPDLPRPVKRDAEGNPVMPDGKPELLDIGEPTGVMGLRRFLNPNFKPAQWNLERYQKDPAQVEPPYLIGMACAFCHVGLNPVRPPASPEHPAWSNVHPGIGNQYLREQLFNVAKYPDSRMPGWNNFFRQVAEVQPRGTSETSQVDTDHINNPNVINNIALIDLRPKHTERTADGVDRQVYHILKDGADSVGAACLDDPAEIAGKNDTACAALRVFVNIGMCAEYWTTLHDPVFGMKAQQPFHPREATKANAACKDGWTATEAQMGGLEAFLRTLKPLKLQDAPQGQQFLTTNAAVLERGRAVFAKSCASCHSSQAPDPSAHFEDGDFLSDDARHPLSEIGTNAARALGSNATAGHIWNDFSSDTYKSLPPVTMDHLVDPYHTTRELPPMTVSGGLGYYRTPTLANVWATAPYLHNNSVGEFNGDPSVQGRLTAYQSGMEQLLGIAPRKGVDGIRRTTQFSKVHFQEGGYVCVPKGTPVDVIANVGTAAPPILRRKNLLTGLVCLVSRTGLLNTYYLRRDLSQDFVADRGHTYGDELPLDEKRALIEYMKLF